MNFSNSVTVNQRPSSAHSNKEGKPKKKRVQQSYFFTDDKHGVGAVITKYPANKPKSARTKPVKAASIPDREEPLSTKEVRISLASSNWSVMPEP